MEFQEHFKTFPFHLISHTALTWASRVKTYLNGHQWEIASFILGVTVHLSLFRKGEWDLAAISIYKAYTLVFVSLNVILFFVSGTTRASVIAEVFIRACALLAAHGCGLTLSICAYRQWFHRLRNFPGPPLAGLSSLYMLLMSLKYHQSETLQSYHQVYGDYVRICPNKLSITDPDAITVIYGRDSSTDKGPFANTTYPRESLNTCRDKMEHIRRRKFWDRALSASSMRSRIPIVNKHAQRLLNQLHARRGQSMNVARWLGIFSFDVLFDVGFGQDKQCVDRDHEDFYMSCAQHFMKITGLIMHTPWMIHFLSWSPTLSAQFGKFQEFSADIVNDRLASPGDRGDLFSIIARSYDELDTKSPRDLENLVGDADLLVLAGADSTAVTISRVLYELAINPAEQDKLRQTLAGVEDFEEFQVRGHTQLEAFINESLRIDHPAPAGHERMTPPEGIRIGKHYIPGNVSVFIPYYPLYRDTRFFDQPTRFIPERWTTQPDLNKDAASVFFPFQTGKRLCPGRHLALIEIRTIISLILSKFTIHPASSDIKTSFIDKRDDRWLLKYGKLDIILRELNGERSLT